MGKVYLVGAGPGAPDLLTIRAARLLREADVVLHDALVHPDVLTLAANAKIIAVGKRCGQVSTDQRFINRLLVEMADRYRVIVRLKGGDPMLFARAREEIDALTKAQVEFEVVPGITAAFAAAADLKTPLTERGVSRSVTFVTPRAGASETKPAPLKSDRADTLVFYMAAGESQNVANSLLARGMSANTPVAIVENASLPEARQLHLTLYELARIELEGFTGPAVLCVGAAFRQPLQEQNTPVRAVATS